LKYCNAVSRWYIGAERSETYLDESVKLLQKLFLLVVGFSECLLVATFKLVPVERCQMSRSAGRCGSVVLVTVHAVIRRLGFWSLDLSATSRLLLGERIGSHQVVILGLSGIQLRSVRPLLGNCWRFRPILRFVLALVACGKLLR
jgi:hypothetical protein